jgi:hypothetical protein
MRKHEVSYHNHSNDIFFLSDHCSHLETLERFFSILSKSEDNKKVRDKEIDRNRNRNRDKELD